MIDAAGDTVRARGVGVRVRGRDPTVLVRHARLVVRDDAGTVVDDVTFGGPGVPMAPAVAIDVGLTLPPAGPFTITAEVGDSSPSLTLTTRRVVRIDDAPYRASALPDLGADAGVSWIDAVGTIAGWVNTTGGARRPAVWRGGTLHVVPTTDSADAIATRVDGAGDVLLQFAPRASFDGHVRVRTAEGAELVLGLVTRSSPGGPVVRVCCTRAADLTESRRAVGGREVHAFNAWPTASVVADLAVMRQDSVPGQLVLMNAAGQAATVVETPLSALYRSQLVVPIGFALPGLPAGLTRTFCDRPGRFTADTPVDLAEDASLLVAASCGSPAWLPQLGTPRWVDRRLGSATVRMARQGGRLLAGLDSAGRLWLWDAGADRVTRVRVPGDAWRFDALGTVNGRGEIAAHGTEAVTGRRAALRLSPAGP